MHFACLFRDSLFADAVIKTPIFLGLHEPHCTILIRQDYATVLVYGVFHTLLYFMNFELIFKFKTVCLCVYVFAMQHDFYAQKSL